MDFVWILLSVLLTAAALILIAAYVCFRMAFYVKPSYRKKPRPEFDLPSGPVYEPFHPQMREWMRQTREIPHEEVSITSFDGLRLCGKLYICSPEAPIEIMLHGYRSHAERDMCGAVLRCFRLGRNALIVDQRAAGKSEGNVITFGVKESRDCRGWVDYLIARFGENCRLMLTGMSMGAATVLITAGTDLPPQVVSVLADCGYTTAREMICKTIGEMKLPAALLYPFVRLGGKVFGGFDVEDASPLRAMSTCRVPVIFIHGEADAYVPCEMSRRNFDACPAEKAIFTVPDADHGLAYLVDTEGYFAALSAFIDKTER